MKHITLITTNSGPVKADSLLVTQQKAAIFGVLATGIGVLGTATGALATAFSTYETGLHTKSTNPHS